MARTKDFDETKVLDKAICLFWHKGYNGTSMQELVDNLGISRSSLYDTYGDKHDLYIKALLHYQHSSGDEMSQIISNAKTAREAIKQLLEFVINNLMNDKQRKGCFMVNAGVEVAPHDPEVMRIITQNEQALEDQFLKTIEMGRARGDVSKKKDARALARFFGNTVKGIQVSAKSAKNKTAFADIIETSLSVLD